LQKAVDQTRAIILYLLAVKPICLKEIIKSSLYQVGNDVQGMFARYKLEELFIIFARILRLLFYKSVPKRGL